jgi:Bacterial Ig-like domain (group 2)
MREEMALWSRRACLLILLVVGLAPSAGGAAPGSAGGSCPAQDPECAAAQLGALAEGLACEKKCRCKGLVKKGAKLRDAVARALLEPKERRCARSLKTARNAAKKIARKAGKIAAKTCVHPRAEAQALADAAAHAREGFQALLDADACGTRLGVTPDAARAASALLGPDGGSLEATGADGTLYALEVPPLALLEETTLTLTPAEPTGLPFSGGPLAAVQLEPSGLGLWVPGTLTVDLPAAPDPAALAGFGWDGTGWSPGLALLEVTDSRLVFAVHHFSGLGAALAAPADLQALEAQPTSNTTSAFTGELVAACGASDPAAFEDALRRWYDDAVAPKLQAAKSDPELTDALHEYALWKAAVEGGFLYCGFPGTPDVGSRLTGALSLASAALLAGIQRADVRCRALGTVHGAEDALRWQAIAEALGLAGPGSGLELDDVVAGLCVEIRYRNTDYTSSPRAGVTSTLTVEAEVSVPNQVPFFQPIHVEVDATGTQEASASGDTDGTGTFTAPFTPAGGQEVLLRIEACLDLAGFPKLSSHLCQTAIVGRGLEVTPAAAQIQDGATQQFSALLLGDPYANVSWSATAGTIDANGLFTADGPGAVTVTATDLASSGSTASATVTVAAGPCAFPDMPRGFVLLNLNNDVGSDSGGVFPAMASATDGASSASGTADLGHLDASFQGITGFSAIATYFEDRFVIDTGPFGRPASRLRARGRLIATGGGGLDNRIELTLAQGDPRRWTFDNEPSVDETLEWTIGRDGPSFDIRVDMQRWIRARGAPADGGGSFQWLGITEVTDIDGIPITGYTVCSASGTDWRQAAP